MCVAVHYPLCISEHINTRRRNTHIYVHTLILYPHLIASEPAPCEGKANYVNKIKKSDSNTCGVYSAQAAKDYEPARTALNILVCVGGTNTYTYVRLYLYPHLIASEPSDARKKQQCFFLKKSLLIRTHMAYTPHRLQKITSKRGRQPVPLPPPRW